MMVERSTALVIAALLVATTSTVTGFMVLPAGNLSHSSSPALQGATAGITGNITIGNVAPLCRVPPSTAPAPSPYNQIEVVITPSSPPYLALTVPVNWALVDGCVVDGTFKIALNPGAYSVTLTSCAGSASTIYPFRGCSGLPKTVIVEASAWTQVEISVITGIY